MVNILIKDVKFIKKVKRDFEDKIEEVEEVLEERLFLNIFLDKLIVEVFYSGFLDFKVSYVLYEKFEKEVLI